MREVVLEVSGNRIRDPWGNNLEIVACEEVQFTKAPEILRGMGFANLEKTAKALAELSDTGLA